MILSLALANMRQRFTRTLITVVAMMLAAAVATSAMSLAQGVDQNAFVDYRDYFGGDIMVFTPTFVGASPAIDEQGTLRHTLLYDSGFNLLARIFPHFTSEGFISLDRFPYVPISTEQLRGLSGYSGVAVVRPRLVMPASHNRFPMAMLGQPDNLAAHLVAGRLPRATVDGVIELVANIYGGSLLPLDTTVDVDVPAFRVGASGVPYVDFSQPLRPITMRVVGHAAWPTRELTYFPPEGGTPITEQAFVHSGEIYLALEDWWRIWRQQSGGQDYPVLAAAISVKDISELNITVAALRRAFPELGMKTVPALARHVERYNLLDHFYVLPLELWYNPVGRASVPAVPIELGLTSAILLFASAGMLLAGQMLAGVAERRKEIGILKALGARRRDIAIMVMLEALFLSAVGSALGFIVVRAMAIGRELGAGVPWAIIIRGTLTELTVVMALTTLMAVIFTAFPAAAMAKLPVMEVFRNE